MDHDSLWFTFCEANHRLVCHHIFEPEEKSFYLVLTKLSLAGFALNQQ
jgi:hypothetical protein